MAAVTVHHDFGTPKIKSATVFFFSPSICHEVMGPDAMVLVFNVEFQVLVGFPSGLDGKESACNIEVPRLGRSPGERNGNPLQYSCL